MLCRFKLENMSINEILPALDLTQSVRAKIFIGMHREGEEGSNSKQKQMFISAPRAYSTHIALPIPQWILDTNDYICISLNT